MSRDYRLRIADIRKCREKIIAFTAGMDQQQLLADERTYDAVLRNFEIIGEASRNIPDDVLRLMTEIDWQRIRRMRNVVAHVYFGVDDNIVWNTIRQKVPELLEAVRTYQSDAGLASN